MCIYIRVLILLAEKMKFGIYLREHEDPQNKGQYLNYDLLKNMIKELEEMEFGTMDDDSLNVRSLTLPRPTNSGEVVPLMIIDVLFLPFTSISCTTFQIFVS